MSDIKKKLDFLVTSHKKLTGSDLNYEIATSYIDLFKRIKNKKTLMISGSQGSGKSTMSLQIKKYFKKYYSKNVVILSIDDFYLSIHQRKLLSKKYKTNLFETRGVPGTHNLKLLSQTIRNLKNNLFSEFVGTFVLVFGIFFIASPIISIDGIETINYGIGSLESLPVGILVWVIGISLGGTTGYAINPARDLGPRIVYQLIPRKNKDADWNYSFIPIFGPILGSVAAGLLYSLIS